eukprot:7017592-Ditylum_brightwellii.AAC.1
MENKTPGEYCRITAGSSVNVVRLPLAEAKEVLTFLHRGLVGFKKKADVNLSSGKRYSHFHI